ENEHFGRDLSGKDTLELILSSDLLIIDDLGAEYDTRFSAATIYNIIDTRLNRSLPVIITTNLTHIEIEERYDARIISRLGCLYDYLKFTGKDVRYLKKNNKDI
ncbi:MAG TPA: DNA replication protein DnaC, partial [Ruminococcus sp.]|nr:DNA replication protein DnaC [Ruminococcus sp.]